MDLRNLPKLKKKINKKIKPDYIFHLAAQSLVKGLLKILLILLHLILLGHVMS